LKDGRCEKGGRHKDTKEDEGKEMGGGRRMKEDEGR
jgi:hypothetical protein